MMVFCYPTTQYIPYPINSYFPSDFSQESLGARLTDRELDPSELYCSLIENSHRSTKVMRILDYYNLMKTLPQILPAE